MVHRFLLLAAALLAASPASAATAPEAVEPHPGCVFSVGLRQRLIELDAENSACRDSACVEALLAESRALAAEYPGQAWPALLVQLYEEKAAAAAGTMKELRERYRQAAAAAPRDATAQYLAGTLERDATPPDWAGIEKTLAIDPGYPLARLAKAQKLLAESKDPASGDPAAAELIRGFVASCPSRAYLALHLAALSPKAEIWLQLIDGLRSALAERPPLEQALVSNMLWSEEFELRPAAEHAALRERIAAELPSIEKLQLKGELIYWDALRKGSELTGADPVAVDRLRAEFLPCDRYSAEAVKGDLRKRLGLPADPRQKVEPTAEQRAGLLAGARAAAERCPQEPRLQIEYFAIATGDPQISNETMVAIADRAEAALALQVGYTRSLRPPGIFVAKTLLDRKAGPATALRLVETSRKDFELMRAWRQGPGSPPPEGHLKVMYDEGDGLLAALEARALIQLGQPAKAGEALATAHVFLNPPEIPEVDGRLQFAKARQEMLAAAPELPAPPELAPPAPLQQEGLFEKASHEFAGEFPLDDTRGKTWQKVELAGKTWLVNLWATWCAPCVAELPHIQKLHEELKDRPDVGVLTLNFDFEAGKVQPFLERKAYTFPVLLASKGFKEAMKLGIPQNWLVDSELEVQLSMVGFDPENPEKALAEIKTELEALSKKGKS
jgi:thiol-disulfide isomerase/thioredoxin